MPEDEPLVIEFEQALLALDRLSASRLLAAAREGRSAEVEALGGEVVYRADGPPTAVGYFDPMSSPTTTPPALARETGLPIARRTIARIKGVGAFHLGSGRCLGIADDVTSVGASILGVSALEDLATLKAACRDKVTVLGNLNGVEMRRWTPGQAEAMVKEAIAEGGPGGGLILADNHGEIPWQVPENVLLAVAEAARRWGRYPLEWVADYAG